MATLQGDSLSFVETLFDDGGVTVTLNSVYSVAAATIGSTTYVYAGSSSSGGVQIMTLSEDGSLTPVTRITDTGLTALAGTRELKVFEVDGNPFLAVNGHADQGITILSLTDGAPYATPVDAVFQSEDVNYNLGSLGDLEILNLSGGTFLYAAGESSDGLSVFSVSSSGVLTSVQNVDDDDTTVLNGSWALTSFQRGSTPYIAAASFADDSVTVFSVNPSTGLLTRIADLGGASNGILDGAAQSDALVIDGTAYIYVPEQSGHAITVLAFDGTTLIDVQRLQSTSFIGGARDAEIVTLGDKSYLVVTAQSDGVLFFEIDTAPLSPTAGELTLVETIEDNNGEGALAFMGHSANVTIGDRTFVLAPARSDHALNVYEIGAGDDLVEGTNAADDLSGGGGDDTLTGFGGNDEMSGGDGGDEMDGGSGNDTMFGGADDDDLFGGSGDDSMEGGAGADMLRGEGGGDLLRGDAGSDWMDGGSGSDTLSGNDGEDTLRGGDDNDAIYGGNDGDAIAGNLGADFLRGNNGDDAVYGGAGNDDLGGDAGNDTVDGGLGDDLLRGGNDDDLLLGGRGADTLAGNSGDDTLRGGADADLIIGGTGTDLMYGDSGADVFVFDNVNQSIHGSARDTIADFAVGVDKIDLSGFAGTLTFVASYTGAGNEVRYSQPTGRLYLDVDGDGASDFSVDVTGNPALTASDLIL